METGEPVLLIHEERTYLCERGTELQTHLGVVTIPEDVTPGETLESHLGEAFHVRRPRGPDLFAHLERTGAPMLPRDVGLIIGLTGARSGDRVLDVGTGTGILAAYLGRIGASVTTYERNEEFAAVARTNMRRAGVADRVEVRTAPVQADLDGMAAEERFDLLTLDTGDAPAIVERSPSLLASGGYLAVYTPFVEDVRRVVETARGTGRLEDIETIETIQRRMDVDERGTRPTTAGVGHSGYLTIARNG